MNDRVPRVLLIEDDPDVRRLVNRALGSDFDVIEASDGAVALQLAESGGFALAIQDLRMPATDPSLTGMRLLYRIHGTLGPLVPILVISGGDLTEVYEAGLFRALPKPFTPAPLRGLVRDLLASSREAAVAVPQHAEALKPRPWWMALLGWLTTVGGLMIYWQLDAPVAVVATMVVLGAMLIWIGPAPADAFSVIMRFLKPPK